jgi:hypothetical protein
MWLAAAITLWEILSHLFRGLLGGAESYWLTTHDSPPLPVASPQQSSKKHDLLLACLLIKWR